MNLRKKSLILFSFLLLLETGTMSLLAITISHSGSFMLSDPVRLYLFLVQFLTFAAFGGAYMLFDRVVCKRLQFLAEESWLSGGASGPEWANGSDELSGLAGLLKQFYLRNTESSERENLIADHALDLICSLNSSRLILSINPASLAQLGYAPVSIIGRSLDKLLVEEEIPSLEQSLERARRELSPIQVDLVMKTMHGTLKDFRWTCEWSESAACYYMVGRDVSSEKELERVKKEFLSMVSHDLRTPITSVKAFMTHLEENGPYGSLSEKGKKQLGAVQENLERMIRLTTDLLDLDKLEAGQMQLELASLKANDLINRSVESVRQLAEQKQVSFKTQNADLEIYGDIHRLTQVLVNLLANAIKFSPEGQSIEINLLNLRHQVEIQVIDHGRGIPPALQELIFERYKQVEAADHKVKKGSGLGLAIAKALVDAHNGQIGVSSDGENCGTKFWFRVNKPRGGK